MVVPDSEPVIIRGSMGIASMSGVLTMRDRERPERA